MAEGMTPEELQAMMDRYREELLQLQRQQAAPVPMNRPMMPPPPEQPEPPQRPMMPPPEQRQRPFLPPPPLRPGVTPQSPISPPDQDLIFPAPLPEFPAENQRPAGWNGTSFPVGERLRPEPGDQPPSDFSLPANPYIRDASDQPEQGVGYLQVVVRTAGEAVPVAGAAVAISDDRTGEHRLMALRLTDKNGMTEPIPLPAPLTPPNLKNVPFAAYTAEVRADGYAPQESKDIPVFAGIRAVQSFELLPLPLNIAPDQQELVMYHQKPDF